MNNMNHIFQYLPLDWSQEVHEIYNTFRHTKKKDTGIVGCHARPKYQRIFCCKAFQQGLALIILNIICLNQVHDLVQVTLEINIFQEPREHNTF